MQPSHDFLLLLQSGTQEYKHLATESPGAGGTEPHVTKHQFLLFVCGPWTGGPVSHRSGPALGKELEGRNPGVGGTILSREGRMGFARTAYMCKSTRDGMEVTWYFSDRRGKKSSLALTLCAFTFLGWVEDSSIPFSRNPLQPQPSTHISRARGYHEASQSMTGAWFSST